MKNRKYRLLPLLFLFYSCAAPSKSTCSALMEYAQDHLPNCGILKKTEKFVYVDIVDDYVHKLISFIAKEGFQEPPYFGDTDLVGAHITAIYPDEMIEYGITEVPECGEVIYFSIKDCKIVTPTRMKEVDKVYCIGVEAPQLDEMRNKYGLPPKKYDFHITIGVKPKAEAA